MKDTYLARAMEAVSRWRHSLNREHILNQAISGLDPKLLGPMMRSTFRPPLWVVLAVIAAVVAGAQIPEGMLMEESLVAPPPETPRQLQTSSASRHDVNSMNGMDVEEEDDQITDEDGSTCYMEIQVTRRIPGRCVSLGRSRGCVAGIYLHPYHHECQ